MNRRRRRLRGPVAVVGVLVSLTSGLPSAAAGEIRVVDDTGHTIILASPARRVVSLAPHVTELVYAAGAGAQLVGVSAFSDYPPAAKTLPRISDSVSIDIERIVKLQPDLIIAWQSGNPAKQVDQLRHLGFPIYVSEPRGLQAIAEDIERLGRLTGRDAVARPSAAAFRARYARVRAHYAGREHVTVFYQILDPQLMTINGRHLISEIIRMCGGVNIFADMGPLSARVNIESVLHADPDVIVASGTETFWPDWRARWLSWPQLQAVKHVSLYYIAPESILRHSPRVLGGAEQLCALLEKARAKRKQSSRADR
jgi:iron complex transport system substrate-binding protein